MDKDNNQIVRDNDNFEELIESKEIIEDRIYRLKGAMIDYTMKQQDLSEKTSNLHKDIDILQFKLEDNQTS